MGYLWDEANTARLIDAEGWVHSGDLGRKDEDGFFFVTGRIKVPHADLCRYFLLEAVGSESKLE